MRVYLDSCIIIYMTEGAADVREQIQSQLLESAGTLPAVVFTDLTRLECRVGPMATDDAMTLADYDDFFATPGYTKFMLDAAYSILPPSGVRAIESRPRMRCTWRPQSARACDGFWTSDQRLASVATEQSIGVVTIAK